MYRPPQYRAMDKKAEPTSMTSGLTDRVSVISSAKVGPNFDTEFKSPRAVGGYSWIDDGEELIIAVPGLPDVWVGGQGIVGQLKPDIEIEDYWEYSDHTGSRLVPENIFRLEPMFHSFNSPSDLLGVQLITDRNALRKIYKLFTPDSVYDRKPFRIDARKIGNVVIFTRWETPDMRDPVPPHPSCYAQSYALATIKRQLERAVSNHRMVRYEFAGLQIVVRFQLDAVIEACPTQVDLSTSHGISVDSSTGSPMSSTSGRSLLPLPKSSEDKNRFRIHRTPYPSPPLSSFMEKKTRSFKGKLDYVVIYSQLVFSQTPHLYVARHSHGHFSAVDKISLGQGELKDIAEATEGIMAKTAGMIKEMMNVVEEEGEVSFVWKGDGSIVEVWKGESQVQISEEAREMLLAA